MRLCVIVVVVIVVIIVIVVDNKNNNNKRRHMESQCIADLYKRYRGARINPSTVHICEQRLRKPDHCRAAVDDRIHERF